tara:strand:+ start:271 stop:738 length:468 start_codon:yes stop_codon:yes gene_type:complete
MIKKLITPKALLSISEACTMYMAATAPEDYDECILAVGWDKKRLMKLVHEITNQILYQVAMQTELSEDGGPTDDNPIWFNCPLWSVVTISSILRAQDEQDDDQPLPLLKRVSYMTMRVAWYPFLQAATSMSDNHDEEEKEEKKLFLKSWEDEETE